MKQGLIFSALLFLISCGGKSISKTSHTNDTTWTTIDAAINWQQNQYATTTAIRIVKDTLFPDPDDKTKNISQLDTAYYVPRMEPIPDSTGKPKLDTAGKPITTIVWYQLPRELILQDFNKKWPYKKQ